MDKYLNFVTKWAEDDANYIKNRGESRSKWRRIRWETIKGWPLMNEEKEFLLAKYEGLVAKLTPVSRATAPEKPTIAVSAF